MHPTKCPPGQNFFQMDYAAASDRMLAWIIPDVVGGNNMWTYDSVSNTWEQVPLVSGPSGRPWTTLTYSDKADQLVLIGGGATRYSFTNEVWIFNLHTKT